MPSGSSPVPIEALLAHQGFVRALARQLVSDPHAAEDLAQETWLKASTSPPREPASLGGWFARVVRNRASNVRRDTNRRTSRERDVARTESIEPTDVAERVELESRVVRAVLALREPYRGVILGRYYEDVGTAELARRQGVTESSVRSQETRALELLRRELDETFDGGRAAWSVLLAPLAARESTSAVANSATPTLALVVGAVLVVVGVVVWRAELGDESQDVASSTTTPEPSRESLPALAHGANDGANFDEQPRREAATSDDAPLVREAAAPPDPLVALTLDATPETLSALDVQDLLRLALHTQRALRARLLTVDAAARAPFAAAIERGESGVIRILRREFSGEYGHYDLLGLREGGAYCAFESGSHDYNDNTDVRLEGGFFDSNGWGLLADLGELELASVPSDPNVVLPQWDETVRALWTVLWRDGVITPAKGLDPAFHAEYYQARANRRQGAAAVGRTYLVRSVLLSARDALYAFRSIGEDEYGHTLVWRKLHEWPVADRSRDAVRKSPTLSAAALGRSPAWLSDASVALLVEVLARVRAVAQPKVLAIPIELAAKYEPYLARHGGAIQRILFQGPLSTLVTERSGAAYLTFRAPAERRADDAWSPFRLWGQTMEIGCVGRDVGIGVDLGELPFDAFESVDDLRDALGALGIEQCRFLWDMRPDGDGQLLSSATETRARSLESSWQPRVGHSYLLRSIRPGDHDFTIVLHVAERDPSGLIVVWRIVRELEPPPK